MNAIHEQERVAPGALAGVDLNLVVAFDALAHERSVTLAAQRIGVTQSAMSHALRRLRALLGDPLLVRGQSGMVLTSRAESLAVPIRSGLVTLGRALWGPVRFEPHSARRPFRIATPDLFDVLVIPALLERVRVEAPGVDLSIVPLEARRLPTLLETGDVDAAIVPRFEQLGAQPVPVPATPGLVRRVLFRDDYTCLLRADHPALRKARGTGKRAARKSLSLTIEAYAALNHLAVSPGGDGRGLIDRALEQHGLSRRIALRIPAFYTALEMVRRSDLILTAPSALARFAPVDGSVAAFPPPIEVPEHTLNLTWHERFTQDPGHLWLRGVLTEVSRAAMRDV